MTTTPVTNPERPPRERRLLTIHEAAALLGVSVPFVYKATRERRFPVTRIGRRLRFDPAALDKFITRQTTIEKPTK